MKPAPIDETPADVLIVDPPWKYKNFTDAKHSSSRSAMHVMEDEDIVDLPIGRWANPKGCILFLWGVFPRLFDAHPRVPVLSRCATSWGFDQFVTSIPWVKTIPGDVLDLRSVMGFWSRGACELLTIWRRGKVSRDLVAFPRRETPVGLLYGDRAAGEEVAFYAPPGKKHSGKPLLLHEYIERGYPGSHLEIFARRPRPNWRTWGNETGFWIDADGVRRIPDVASSEDPMRPLF